MPRFPPAPPGLMAALGAAWLLSLTLVYPSTTRLDVWPWAAIASAGWLSFIAAALLGSPRFRFGGTRDWGLLACASTGVFSAWASPWQPGSLASALIFPGSVALAYLLLSGFSHVSSRRVLESTFDLLAGILVIASLGPWLATLLMADNPGGAWARRNDALFGHSNYTAGAALLSGSWLAAGGLSASGWSRHWRFAAAALSILLILTTSSRAAVGALGLIAIAGVVAWWWRRGLRAREAAVGIATLAVVLAAGVGSNERLRDLVLQGQWSPVASDSNNQRLAMASVGWTLGREHGLLGAGPGTVPLAFNAGSANVPAAPDGALQLHSTPIQVWATMGPAGLIAVLVLLAGVAPVLWQAFKPTSAPASTALAIGFVAYGFFALADHQFDIPFILVFALGHLIVLCRPAAHVLRPMAAKKQILIATAGLLITAGPAIYRIRDLGARAAFTDAVRAHDFGASSEAIAALQRARAWAPWDRYYAEAAAAWTWDQDRIVAMEYLREALETRAPWPSEFALYNLAWLELDRAGLEEMQYFEQAALLAPHRTGVFFGLGMALGAAGDRQAAIEALARECIANPVFITDPAWSEAGIRELQAEVGAAIDTLARQLHPLLADTSQQRQLRQVVRLAQWWRSPSSISIAELTQEASPELEKRLRAVTAAPRAGAGSWDGAEHWGILGETWAAGQPPSTLDEAWRNALLKRLEQSTDFISFVTAPVGDVPIWRRAFRVSRGGYGIVMRHPDSPALSDFPIFEENTLLKPHTSALFPRRGWLPGQTWRMLDDGIAKRQKDV